MGRSCLTALLVQRTVGHSGPAAGTRLSRLFGFLSRSCQPGTPSRVRGALQEVLISHPPYTEHHWCRQEKRGAVSL